MRYYNGVYIRRIITAILVALGLAVAGHGTADACPRPQGVWHESYIVDSEWVQCNYCGAVIGGDEQYGHYQTCTQRPR